VSETNNCAIVLDGNGNPSKIEMPLNLGDAQMKDFSITPGAGSSALLSASLQGQKLSKKKLDGATLEAQAAPTNGFRKKGIPLAANGGGSSVATAAGGTVTQRRTVTLKLPKRVRRGKYFVRVCVRSPTRGGDERSDNDCKVTRKPVTLRR